MIKTSNVSSLLYCSNLTKYYQYPDYSIKVLQGITLNVQYSEFIAIVGSSGSGKSTLLHLMGGLDTPTGGNIFFEGKELHKLSDKNAAMIRNKRIGFVYQFHHLLPDFNVLENIAMPLLIGGVNNNIAKNKARLILEFIGLENRYKHYPHELSGGESQRVAVGRSVINNPSLVLADEPTGSLDKKNSDNIFQLLKTLHIHYSTSVIIATHDLYLANKCNKIFMISNGLLEMDMT